MISVHHHLREASARREDLGRKARQAYPLSNPYPPGQQGNVTWQHRLMLALGGALVAALLIALAVAAMTGVSLFTAM